MRVASTDDAGIPFNATADASAHVLYWFVNNAYVGRATPGQTFNWRPAGAGSYTVRVTDDHGNSDERPLGVALVQ